MRRLVAFFIISLGLCLSIFASGSQTSAQTANCAGTPPSRLAIGMQGQVTKTPPGQTPQPVRVRVKPAKNADVVANLPDLTRFDVINGSVCADGYVWWQIRAPQNVTGWIAEGDRDGYYVEPYFPPTATLAPGAQPATDTTKILFVKGEKPHRIFLMNADGTDQIPLTSDAHDGKYPVWSPDGKRIAFVEDDVSLVIMNADGTNLVSIDKESQRYIDSVAWSPMGTHIAFHVVDPTNYTKNTLFIINPDGSARTQIAVDTTEPSWSSDDKSIAYSLFGGNIITLRVKEIASGKTADLGEGWDPAWSPDGKAIAFVFFPENQSADPKNPNFGWYLDTLPPVGGDRHKLYEVKETESALFMPVWSRDSKNIAFWQGVSAEGSYRANLYVNGTVLNNTGQWYILLDYRMFSLSWSPDNTKIVFNVNTIATSEVIHSIFTIDVKSGQATQLAEGEYPSWQP